MPTPCVHFGLCGGCAAQDVPYPEQVAAKQAALRELLLPHYDGELPVTPSPVVWHYRNKIDPVFTPQWYETPPPEDVVRETVLGYKRRGKWFFPMQVDECLIGPEGTEPLFAAAREWAAGSGFQAFDTRRGGGFLKTLLVRDAKRSGERMVVLITASGDMDTAPFVEAALGAFGPCSVWRGTREGSADNAQADTLELLHGPPHITETLEISESPARGTSDTPSEHLSGPPAHGPLRLLDFRISPMSFFQTNPLGAERLYGLIRARVRRLAPGVLYDLYGGMGSIALACADLVREVRSVENVAAASQDGGVNCAVNGVDNVSFVTESVPDHLRRLREEDGLPPDALVVTDPPRCGMNPKTIRRLLELAPERLMYVSCNPRVLAAELALLAPAYRVVDAEAVDLFPHTPHVETIVELARV
ncbi:MAG TPA: hypothetical protein PKN23_04560 [Candidatus Hydrogenedentes bacterium]|nr:hypothetical protein [Candidatus Hydrogenedentota bacterium]HOH49246.1 hypothetical protein [Candidatus Hydrogenedentota bacterium]